MKDRTIAEFARGHQRFREITFHKNKERFKTLVKEGQNPKALFIGCSDARVMPSLITGAKPGDLFVVRNIGNFVAPFSPDNDYHATAAAIEYAVGVLQVSDIIVCGHSHCGAIASLFKEIPANKETIHTRKWLELGDEAKQEALRHCKSEEKERLLRYTEQLSVIKQLDNLLSYPAVKKGVENGAVFLHAWHYEIESGTITYYDDDTESFVPLES